MIRISEETWITEKTWYSLKDYVAVPIDSNSQIQNNGIPQELINAMKKAVINKIPIWLTDDSGKLLRKFVIINNILTV